MQVGIKSCRACGRVFKGAEVFCPEDGSRLLTRFADGDEPLDRLIGSTLGGRYRILRMIGQGGMGIVYEAEHLMIERRVAVKVLREDFCRRADVVERFRREAKSASRIGHPNIVDVLDFGETPDGASFFVMEMLAGEDLADLLSRQGALSAERAVAIVYQCCHALGVAHDKGIVHRDVKPENILLVARDDFSDFVKIVDFGVAKMSEPELDVGEGLVHAKLTRTGMIFGTPEYMSPEQAAGLVPDHRVDIYAIGVTLYELLSGRVPYEGESFMAVLTKHANQPLPALREVRPGLQISPELEEVVSRALCKNRDERFQHMREMADALKQVPEMPAFPFSLSIPPGPPRPSQPPREHDAELRRSAITGAPAAARHVTSRQRSLALGLLVTLLAGGAALAAYRLVRTQALPIAHSGSSAQVVLRAPQADLLAVPSASTAAVRAPERVTIHMTTDPAGATVRLSGGAQLCATTPCEFEAVPGMPIALQARRGQQQAKTILRPLKTTDLHLVLNAPTRRSVPGSPTPIVRDDLKVPEIFREVR